MRYVNLTPRWTEILPTWLMMFEQAITGDCTNPDLVKDNAKTELRRMAEAADKFNDLCQKLERVEQLIEAGIQAHGDELYGPIAAELELAGY